MLSFTDTPVTKEQLVNSLKSHQAADEIIQGTYWEDGKGCAVGCSIVDFDGSPSSHSEFERLFGIPCVLARIEDSIFEGLSVDDSKWWPVAFAEAVPEGINLSNVIKKFLVWLLGDVKKHASEDGKKSIDTVIGLYQKEIDGESVSREEWRAAYADAAAAADAAYADADADAAAYADADAAAYAAAYADSDAAAYADSDAADAAYAYAYAYADAAADAADAAAAAAAAAAAEKSRKKQADKLIEILMAEK